MAAQDNKPVEDEAAPSVGEWIVTFSDCMTLLLCFFVLLLTFSSFDEESLKRFGGAFDYDHHESAIFEGQSVRDSMIEPIDHIADQAREGSETPTDMFVERDDGRRSSSKLRWIADSDAYRDRKVIHIPCNRLFRGRGRNLTGRGRRYLSMIAGFMKKLSCRVVISESSGRHGVSRSFALRRAGLDRAWSVMAYLTEKEGLAKDRFNVSATSLAKGEDLRRGDVVELVLLARKIYE